ncbi:conjugative transfer aggregate stability protein [Sulfuritalea hydrogenivorans sk43H]|uniref:Conjugative transfer aggregate stability protein n=1 Tax=Sulfuritalea hydrogenivorans sk43H TaxID=1223802 RepID=W0SF21_9PROT|nr:conjugative transfer aggregate stability protein [Sulfuritalea hydrogenivorans sk43H]
MANDMALLGCCTDIDAGELNGRVGGYGVVPGDQGIGGAINRECRTHARVARNKIDRITLLSPKCVRIRCLAGTVHDFGHARPRELPHAPLKQASLAGSLSITWNNRRRVCRTNPLLRPTNSSGPQ